MKKIILNKIMSVPKRPPEILPDIQIGNKYNPNKTNYNKTQYFVVKQNVDLGKIINK